MEKPKRARRRKPDTAKADLKPLLAAPVLPPEMWKRGVIGKYYRPLKTAVSVRVDNDVLDWLKSKGEGHLTRINEILRERMLADRKRPDR